MKEWGLTAADEALSVPKKQSKLTEQQRELEKLLKAEEGQIAALEKLSQLFTSDPAGKKKTDNELAEHQNQAASLKTGLSKVQTQLSGLTGYVATPETEPVLRSSGTTCMLSVSTGQAEKDLGDARVIEGIAPVPQNPEETSNTLVEACRRGEVGAVTKLLAMLPTSPPQQSHVNTSFGVNYVNKTGETCLHVACDMGHVEIVRVLLQQPNLDLNLTRPLLYCTKAARSQIVKLMLGAMVEAACAAESRNGELEEKEREETIQHVGATFVAAAKNGLKDIVATMLTLPPILRPRVNFENSEGTALSTACREGHAGVVDLLLKEPSLDLNCGDPLWYASQAGHLVIVNMLLSHPRTAVNKMNLQHKTPLVVSILHNRPDVARALISHGGSIPKACEEEVLAKIGYKGLYTLFSQATSIELYQRRQDEQSTKQQLEKQIMDLEDRSKTPDTNRTQDSTELTNKLCELQARVETLEQELADQRSMAALDAELYVKLESYSDHVLLHLQQGVWCNVLPECQNLSSVTITLSGRSPFSETICRFTPLDKVVKIVIQRKFGINEAEQLVFAKCGDTETPLADSSLTLASLDSAKLEIEVKVKPLLSIQEKNLESITTIGTGSYGLVSKECLHSPFSEQVKIVAVKSLHEAIRSELHIDNLWREYKIASSLRHPNIVNCIGTCLNSSRGLCIVYELAEFSLRQLTENRGLSFQEIIAIGLGISKGMHALHRQSIIHRDLSSNNILLDASGIPKIIDFGMSKNLTCGASTLTRAPGTLIYMSPQMFTNHYSLEGDMWQFGILFGDLLAAEQTSPPRTLADIKRFLEVQKSSLSPEDCAELDQLCANTDVGEGIVVEFLNRRNSCLRATSKLDSKFPNLHPICSQLVALIVKSCLSIRECNRPPFSVIEKLLYSCASIVFSPTVSAPTTTDDEIALAINKCLSSLAFSFSHSHHH
ncbi:TKL protein kinase [Pelomyxa schiedti]|nr:TKL protein kinase [Pelomyxa schiedti]